MTDTAGISVPARPKWRIVHSITAFMSGLIVPPLLLFGIARALVPADALASGTPMFWGTVIIGSLLASLAVYRHKRIPLWLAAVVGPVTVLTLAIAPLVWQAVLGAT
jgi:hypothetical protein